VNIGAHPKPSSLMPLKLDDEEDAVVPAAMATTDQCTHAPADKFVTITPSQNPVLPPKYHNQVITFSTVVEVAPVNDSKAFHLNKEKGEG
jgi:hypothetical protein